MSLNKDRVISPVLVTATKFAAIIAALQTLLSPPSPKSWWQLRNIRGLSAALLF